MGFRPHVRFRTTEKQLPGASPLCLSVLTGEDRVPFALRLSAAHHRTISISHSLNIPSMPPTVHPLSR